MDVTPLAQFGDGRIVLVVVERRGGRMLRRRPSKDQMPILLAAAGRLARYGA